MPGDLVLAVADVRLLRKVFKRLVRRHGGMRYARAALTDLEQRTDQIATSLVQALREMIANPNFYEEWGLIRDLRFGPILFLVSSWRVDDVTPSRPCCPFAAGDTARCRGASAADLASSES